MADSVDTMIENAVSRATSAGNHAVNEALEAVSGVNPRKLNKKLPAIKPVPGNARLVIDSPESSSGTSASFSQTVEDALSGFFDNYFAPADAYEAAQAWAVDALTTSNPELPGSNLDLIWGRAQEHTQALGDDLSGLDLPAEALTTHTTPAYAAFVHAESYARSAAKVSLWKHAVSLQLKDLRAAAISATGNYIKALAHSDVAALRGDTAIAEAKTQLKRTVSAWFVAQLGKPKISADIAAVENNELVSTGLVDAEQNVNTVELKVTAAVQGAEAIGVVAQAAAASSNAIVSSSTTGFA